MTSGYSGTPLVRKLGIRPGMRLLIEAAPRPYAELVADLPPDVALVDDGGTGPPVDLVHLFVTAGDVLRRRLRVLRRRIHPAGVVWVSWPKRAAQVATDVTEDVVRDAALAAGLVDVKVCAIDETWSGLKLVVRLVDRV